MSDASWVPAVPVTDAKRRVSVPPGVVVEGVATAVAGAATLLMSVLTTARNCRFAGRTSVRSTAVTVCPVAMSTSIRYWRGKFGPVAVSSSGPM